MLGVQARAGDVEFEVRVLGFKLAELVVENDVGRGADAVEDADLCFKLATGCVADETTERGDARSAGDADQMFVRFEHRQEAASRRDDPKFLAGFNPVDEARAHFAVALYGDFVATAIERA